MHQANLRPVLFAIALTLPLAVSGTADANDRAQAPEHAVLKLTETAERMVPRDRAEASLRIEVSGESPRAIQDAINRAMAAALAIVEEAASAQVSTGSYNVHRVYDRKAAEEPRWVGTQSLTVSGRDIPAVLELATELQSEGLLMSGLRFDVSPETARAIEDELTAEALRNLRARAERIAAVMGMTVARYKTLAIGNANGARPVPYQNFMAMDMAAQGASVAGVAAEPGEASVSVNVNAEVVLRPAASAPGTTGRN